MNQWEFSFEESPWERMKSTLRRGDTLSAVRFLSIMENEDEQYAEDAALELEELGVLLDISALPVYAGGEVALRLQREQELSAGNQLLECLGETDPLRLYLEDVAAQKPCSDANALARRCAAGDQKAMEQLTQGYLYRVVHIAREYTGHGVLLLDLCQEGSLGLWQSILRYQSGDFDTQAQWWIRSAMARLITLQARASGVGVNLSQALERYRQADRNLLTRLGHNPTREEIALELGITPDEAQSLEMMLQNVQAVSKAKAGQESQEPAAEDEQAVEDTAYFQMRQRISELLSVLSEEEARILTLRFGLEGGKPMGPEEIGKNLGLTPEDVLSREAKALEIMRKERGM